MFCIEIAPVCVCGGESCSEFRFANFRGNSNVGKLSNKIPHRKIDTYSPPPITCFDDFNESLDNGKQKGTVQSAL